MKILALPILFIISSVSNLSAEDKFIAKIVDDPKTETTSIRITIPKSAQGQPIRSIYLKRKSVTGLDLHIPIMAQENAEDYSIIMILPTNTAKNSFIDVSLYSARTPNKDGTFTSSSAVQRGESYEIPLVATEKK